MEDKILQFRAEISDKVSLVDTDIIMFNRKIKETSNVIEKIAFEGIIRHLVNERTSYVDLLNKYKTLFEID